MINAKEAVRYTASERDKLKAINAELLEALELMLTDYRTEGCRDPGCLVCGRSHVATDKARAAIAKATEGN